MKCSGKEWDTCRVEKMGCIGCFYDEIETGEYIRTESGHIFKVDEDKKVLEGIKFLNVQYGRVVAHNKKFKELVKSGDVLKYTVNSNVNRIDVVQVYINPKDNSEYLGVKGWGIDQIKILKFIPKEHFENTGYLIEEV